MDDLIIIGVLLLLVGLAVWYIVKAKRSGKKCIGCPDSDRCNGHCTGCACDCASDSPEGE
ncbi:MAG: FeoB-associated Cys-rich membrane protein [Clostridia bacterium]|nr:FeoB-associated Cys-rich membrane protein [Clostridia bacterium]